MWKYFHWFWFYFRERFGQLWICQVGVDVQGRLQTRREPLKQLISWLVDEISLAMIRDEFDGMLQCTEHVIIWTHFTMSYLSVEHNLITYYAILNRHFWIEKWSFHSILQARQTTQYCWTPVRTWTGLRLLNQARRRSLSLEQSQVSGIQAPK